MYIELCIGNPLLARSILIENNRCKAVIKCHASSTSLVSLCFDGSHWFHQCMRHVAIAPAWLAYSAQMHTNKCLCNRGKLHCRILNVKSFVTVYFLESAFCFSVDSASRFSSCVCVCLFSSVHVCVWGAWHDRACITLHTMCAASVLCVCEHIRCISFNKCHISYEFIIIDTKMMISNCSLICIWRKMVNYKGTIWSWAA